MYYLMFYMTWSMPLEVGPSVYSTATLFMHAQPAITFMHMYVHCYPLMDIATQRPCLLHLDRDTAVKEALLVEVGGSHWVSIFKLKTNEQMVAGGYKWLPDEQRTG